MYYAVTQQTDWISRDSILIAVFLMQGDAEDFVASLSEYASEDKYKVTEIPASKYSAFVSMHPKNDKEST